MGRVFSGGQARDADEAAAPPGAQKLAAKLSGRETELVGIRTAAIVTLASHLTAEFGREINITRMNSGRSKERKTTLHLTV